MIVPNTKKRARAAMPGERLWLAHLLGDQDSVKKRQFHRQSRYSSTTTPNLKITDISLLRLIIADDGLSESNPATSPASGASCQGMSLAAWLRGLFLGEAARTQ